MSNSTVLDDSFGAAFRKESDWDAEQLPTGRVLGEIRYGVRAEPPQIDPGHGGVALDVHMTDGGDTESFAEVWTTRADVTTGERDGIRYAWDGEYLLCAGRIPPAAKYAAATERAYVSLLRTLREINAPTLFRMWNFIGDINADNADGLEVYRDFCLGRARAFERTDTPLEQLCAATGIGARGAGVSFYSLSTRSRSCTQLENPRQMSAYQYPRQYGPKSPSFSRATRVRHGQTTASSRTYVSGTASIVGHRTVHEGDLTAQWWTSVENIALVIGSAGAGHTLADLDQIKVYVRHAEDLDRVRCLAAASFSPHAQIAFLNVDVCRAELLVEIEGVV